MYESNLGHKKIPPNFLNSILTNDSLYKMFKDDYENNEAYFGKVKKEEYIKAMIKHIENNNISNNYIERFYDDFIYPWYKVNPINIFKNTFLRNIVVSNNTELCNYIFSDLDYNNIVKTYVDRVIKDIKEEKKLSIGDYDLLSNYIKNNIYDRVNIDLVVALIKSHVYRKNHIFDQKVVKALVTSVFYDYIEHYKLDITLEFTSSSGINTPSYHDLNTNTIYIDSLLIDTFIFGNYVEIFNSLFMELTIVREATLFKNNNIDYDTYKVLCKLIVSKVDLTRIYKDDTYIPSGYINDLKASCFIKTLRFYESFGINLYDKFIRSRIVKVKSEETGALVFKKEISLEITFQNRFINLDKEKIEYLLNTYPVLNLFYDKTGTKRRTIDLIKERKNKEKKEIIDNYLLNSIFDPEIMIDDMIDFCSFKAQDEEEADFVYSLCKYIYVDFFYYSLNSIIKLNYSKSSFKKEEYLNNLLSRIEGIKDNDITHDFIESSKAMIKDALHIID